MRLPSSRVLIIAAALVALLASAVVVTIIIQGAGGGADPAVRRWAREVARDPEDVGAKLQLGFAHQAAGDHTKALEQYDAVLKREPRNTAALFNRATVWREQGEDKLAEEGFWDVLEIEPDHVGAATRLGRLYASKEQFRSVLAAVRPVVSVHPESSDLQFLTGLAYENLGRADWAAARYRLALEASPDMPEAREGLERLGERR